MIDREAFKKTIVNFYDARARSEYAETLSHLHQDCSFRIVGTPALKPFTRTVNSLLEIDKTTMDLFDDWDLSGLKSDSVHIDGDTAHVHRSGTVTFKPTKTTFETELMDKFVIKDGKIVEYLQFTDTYQIAKHAGF
jgi:ketosteroid isomerase-like protein